MRGNLVIARCYGGSPAVLRIWELGRNVVYLSEESQYQLLCTGKMALAPIGFPLEDVFMYDPRAVELIAGGSLDWSSLNRFRA